MLLLPQLLDNFKLIRSLIDFGDKELSKPRKFLEEIPIQNKAEKTFCFNHKDIF